MIIYFHFHFYLTLIWLDDAMLIENQYFTIDYYSFSFAVLQKNIHIINLH